MTYNYHDLLSLKSPLIVVVVGCLLVVQSQGVNGQVSLSLGHTPLANNSVVLISDIGDGATGGPPLICTTTFRWCCGTVPDRYGHWYYPNDTMVPNLRDSEENGFYRNRDSNPGRVILHRKRNALSPLGAYYCEVPLNSATNLQRLTVTVVAEPPTTEAPTTQATTTTEAPTTEAQVTLSLGTTSLANNSVVLITDIGDAATGGSPLICTTTFRPCCSSSNRNPLGQWHYPDDTMVDNSAAGEDFYRNRGDDGTVRLHRRYNARSPTGTYYCEIPVNSATDLQRLTVRVVTDIPMYTTEAPAIEVNECTSRAADCVDGATCMNTVGSFTCTCPSGLIGDGRTSGTGCTGVSLSLRGTTLSNNSAVLITDIGFDDSALLCLTNNTQCCRSGDNPNGVQLGWWFFPNGSEVVSFAQGGTEFQRTGATGEVRLNRNTQFGRALSPTGVYRCVIPDANGVNQTLLVTVEYNECTAAPSAGADDCVSGATCVDTLEGFTCTCPSGLAGDGRTYGTGCTALIITGNTGGHIEVIEHTIYNYGLPLFDVTVEGVDELSFQSSKDGVNISDGVKYKIMLSKRSLKWGFWLHILPPLTPKDTGDYRVILSYPGGTTTLDTKSVTVYIDECARRTDDCVSGANCVKTIGYSFNCTCPFDFTGDGRESGTGCIIPIFLNPSGTPIAGEQYRLNCTVTGSTRTPTFTWLGPPSNTSLPSNTRVVSGVMSSGSTHTSILQFDPMQSSHEGVYTCQVTVGTVTDMRSTQVNAEEPVITAMVSASGTPTVGQSYSLTCTVTGADRLNPTLAYKWFKDYPELEVGKDLQTLSFSILSQSDAGEYRCDVAVSSTLLSHRIRVTGLLYNLIAPTPNITAIVSGSTPTVGQSYSLTCTVTGADRLNPTITYKWFKINPESEVGNNSRILSFPPLRLSDAGQLYRCAVTLTSDLLIRRIGASSKPQQLRIPTVLFQLRLNGIPKCFDWALTDTTAKALEIADILVQAVEQKCECGFTRGYITEDAFQCFPESQQHVSFRARLTETSQATTPQLITLIEQWAVSTRTIPIQHFRVGVNSTCDVVVNEFDSPECLERDTQTL